jgi:hypothetical protein
VRLNRSDDDRETLSEGNLSSRGADVAVRLMVVPVSVLVLVLMLVLLAVRSL